MTGVLARFRRAASHALVALGLAGALVAFAAGCGGEQVRSPSGSGSILRDPEVRDTRAAIVRVLQRSCDGGQGEGTGFVVGPGLVATAAHVVEGTERTAVQPADAGGRFSPATVVARDARADVAVLRWPAARGIEPIPIRRIAARRGSPAAIYGFPLPTEMQSAGVSIASVGRELIETDRQEVMRDVVRLRPGPGLDVENGYGYSGSPVVTGDGTTTGVLVGAYETAIGLVPYAARPEVLRAAVDGRRRVVPVRCPPR